MTIKELIVDQLADAGIDFGAIFPSSMLSPIQKEMVNDPRFETVVTSNESEAIGMCAGAWLGGKKPVLIMENSGLPLIPYALLRTHAAFGIPLLMIIDYRGEPGDGNWYMLPIGRATEPLLDAIRVPYEILDNFSNIGLLASRLYNLALHSKYPTAMMIMHRDLVNINETL